MKNGHIVGAGIDIVENRRMRDVLERWEKKFKDRVFLDREQEYCESKASPSSHYAARFAVKEAVTKAFGTGVGPQLSWLDIEVVRDSSTGAPSVKLSERADRFAKKRGAGDILVSLSHTKNYSVAQALVLGRNTD